jgi:PadR family transcriptional regulator AphA
MKGACDLVGISTLGYAVLTLLARASLSGYDLAQRMQKPIGFFWQVQRSQIYPELAHLEEQGYVQHQLIVQQDRPSKKLYTLTAAGRSALATWVTQPPTPAPARHELLLKVFAIWLANPEAALALFRMQEQFHEERLSHFEQIQSSIEAKFDGVPPSDNPCFGDYATVWLGVASERASLLWCRWMAEQLARGKESQH